MADKRYVFLSYGRKDVYQGETNAVEQDNYQSIVEMVYKRLQDVQETTGLEPWFDKPSLTYDRQFTDSIYQGIEQSEYMLLFIGAHSLRSKWCEREWKHAIANCVPVIPILLQGKWGYKCLSKTYPDEILKNNGIDPRNKDKSIDRAYLIDRIVSAIQQKPAPLADAIGARKLPEHYIERKQYVDALKKELGVNDKNYAGRKNIVGITSQQETAALQGIGGIGKTTLALAVCADCEVRRGFDQIFWLEAGPQTEAEDAARLMQIIGTQMGDAAENYKDVQSARASLHRYLNGKRSLLVLDDVWAEGLVEQFSWAGADCRLLVTTRNKGLVEHPQQVAKLGTEEGLRLLATIFDPLNPDVTKLNDDHKAIVTMLDGYTLAIAIAGKWLMKYGQQRAVTYLSRLKAGESDLFKQLEMSKSDKNANLELSLSLSYNDLEPDDQQRFRALGIFAAGSSFSQAALDAVWGLEDGFMETQRLVDVGLLEAVKGTHDDERFSQHNLLRAYAKALLEKAGEMDELFGRYADFYTGVAEQFRELPPEQWGLLDDELPHIHAVGDELVKRTDMGQSGDLNRAVTFANNITNYLARRRQVRRVEWLEMGLSAVRLLEAQSDNREFYQRYESLFLNEFALMWSNLGENRKALVYLEQALPLRRAVGDKGGEAATLTNMGKVWDDLGEKHKALEYYDQALPLYQAVGDKGGEATTLNNIGGVWYALGEKRKALEYYDQALPLRRAVGDKAGEATTLSNIGMVWYALGEKRKALEYYDQALPLRRAVGDKAGEATTLSNIGMVWYALGEKHKALEYYDQAHTLYQAVGDKGGEATTLNNIGGVWYALGEKRKALEYYDQALPLRRAVGDKAGEATILSNIGMVWYALGEKRKALEYYDQALPLRRAVGDKGGEATTLNNIAAIYYHNAELEKALKIFQEIVIVVKEIGDVSSEALFHANIAKVYRKLNDIKNALAELREAIAILKRYDLPYDAGGISVQNYEETLGQWEHERDVLPPEDKVGAGD